MFIKGGLRPALQHLNPWLARRKSIGPKPGSSSCPGASGRLNGNIPLVRERQPLYASTASFFSLHLDDSLIVGRIFVLVLD